MISEHRHTTIYCDLDGPDCTVEFETYSWSFMKNREAARKAGWQLGKDRQYCPNCRTRKKNTEPTHEEARR